MSAIRLARMLLMAVLACAASACNHREFLTESQSRRMPVAVEFDWTLDPEASPKEMTVYFFREGSKSTRPIAYDFKGRDGGKITLLPGTYAAIGHNNDSDRHGFVGYESYGDFGLRLNDNLNAGSTQGSPHIRATDERIAHTPDPMWVSAIDVVEIKDELTVGADSVQTVRFEMVPVVARYIFHVRNPINFNKSISVWATISGMASTVHPAPGMTGEETVMHMFDMQPTAEGNLYGEILTFGHCGGKQVRSRDDASGDDHGPHVLTIHAAMADGKVWYSAHDVTSQIHGSATQDCVIQLDSITFPKGTSGGGFTPSVGGWTGDHEEIGM